MNIAAQNVIMCLKSSALSLQTPHSSVHTAEINKLYVFYLQPLLPPNPIQQAAPAYRDSLHVWPQKKEAAIAAVEKYEN